MESKAWLALVIAPIAFCAWLANSGSALAQDKTPPTSALLAASTGSATVAKEPPTKTEARMMCGVDVRHTGVSSDANGVQAVTLEPSVAQLKEEVEQGLAEPVSCLLEPGLYLSPLHDYALVQRSPQDGKLYVLVDPQYLDQSEIAHELLHLKLRTEGVFVGSFDVKSPDGVDARAVAESSRQVADLMQHRLFFDRLRAMGFDPVAMQRASVRILADKNFHFAQEDQITFVAAVWSYVEAATFFDDRLLTYRYGERLGEAGEPDAASVGARIAKSIRRSDPYTEAEMRAEAAKDFTILFGKKFTPEMFTPRDALARSQ
jgi:hypothetical protein